MRSECDGVSKHVAGERRGQCLNVFGNRLQERGESRV